MILCKRILFLLTMFAVMFRSTGFLKGEETGREVEEGETL
jgi:hypothetical protein